MNNNIFTHPEVQEGEVYLGDMTEEDFKECRVSSKRKGEQISNKNWYPIFVKEGGIYINYLRPIESVLFFNL